MKLPRCLSRRLSRRTSVALGLALGLPLGLAGCGLRDPVAGAPIVELSEPDQKTLVRAATVDVYLDGPAPLDALRVLEPLEAALAEKGYTRGRLGARGPLVARGAPASPGVPARAPVTVEPASLGVDPAFRLEKKLERPVLVVDAEPATGRTDSLYPGLAGRIALFLPGAVGPAFDYVYYLPFGFHPDDAKAQARHLRRAIDEALEDVPERPKS